MKNFVKILYENLNSYITDKNGYCLQVYGDGKKGNIKKGGKVLSRFFIGEEMICFYFSQDDNQYLFDCRGHYISVDSNVDEIKRLKHKDAELLCNVINRFIADNN